jgi:signal transduction histidine kinase
MADQNSGRLASAPHQIGSSALVPAAGLGAAGVQERLATIAQRKPRPNPWTLRNWRIRWRLLALVIIPTVAAIILGAVRIEAARSTAAGLSRVSQLAVLSGDVTNLTHSVEDEESLTVGDIAARQSGETALASSLAKQLAAQETTSNSDLAAVKTLAGHIGPALSGVPSTDLATGINAAAALPDLRALAQSKITALPMTQNYETITSALVAFDNDIALGGSNAQLSESVSALGALAQVGNQVALQRSILFSGLFQGKFEPGAAASLSSAQSSETTDLGAFQVTAANLPAYQPGANGGSGGFSTTTTEATQFSVVTQSPQIDAVQATEAEAIIAGNETNKLGGGTAGAEAWFTDMTDKLTAIRGVEADDLDGVQGEVGTLNQGAVGSERLTAIIVLLLLLLVFGVTILVAQSVIRPLRRLRTDALDVANRRLPEMVRQLSMRSPSDASAGSVESVQLEPIGIDSTDEIGEVARAFDQVHGEAVRLAAEEALLRANLNAMFVNLSRRSQSLIERQLGIIEGLEQSEQDGDRLSSLFRLDHLATRMRRNSENLLVLAGHEAPRKWTKPVPLVDVLRAAVSEIEQYDRIALNAQAGLLIAGRAASDVVHLVAELAENATTFSREDTHVRISSQQVVSGGVLIEITDEGLGIPEQELAHANWRLDNPPVIDVAVSRRMGLFVVGRLAARHGIRVRLRPSAGGNGLSALIWVPDAVAEHGVVEAPAPGGLRRAQTADFPAVATVSALPIRTPRGQGETTDPVPAVPAPTPAPTSSWFVGKKSEDAAHRVPSQSAQEAAWMADAAASADADADGPPPRRLPIFDSVESDWFRRGAPVAIPAEQSAPGQRRESTPAAQGFRRAASAVRSPATDTPTVAGLPKRRAGANLVPGSIAPRNGTGTGPTGTVTGAGHAGGQIRPQRPARSAEEVRARMSSFQLKGRAGRVEGRQFGSRGNGG